MWQLFVRGIDMSNLAIWSRKSLHGIGLDAAGILALADLATIGRRTALTGGSCYADSLVICPGIHRQSDALCLHNGEYPITANISSGYVFRIENQATVNYMQSIGRTGCLVNLSVKKDRTALSNFRGLIDLSGKWLSTLLYLVTISLTLTIIALLIAMEDFWGVGIILFLVIARLCLTISIKRRCRATWHGASEPNVVGVLLVLLSQDRWVRIQGQVDDLKAVTSGQWLRDSTILDEALEGIATVIVYASAALASNASQVGKVLLVALMLINAGILSVSNNMRHSLYMKGFIISQTEPVRAYKRRLDMADELIAESGRDDWAAKLGLVLETKLEQKAKSEQTKIDAVEV